MWAYDGTKLDNRSILADLRWLLLMWRLKRWAGAMNLSERNAFFAALAPTVGGGRLMMPHAITHITVEDLLRAARAAQRERGRVT